MAIAVGGNLIAKMYAGTSEIALAYLGTTQVWQSGDIILPPLDAIPDAFAFPAATLAPRSTLVESAAIIIGGFETPVNVSISAGEYQIGVGPWTSAPGMLSPGQPIRVRLTSSNAYETLLSTTLTVGGVTGSFNLTTRGAGEGTPPVFTSNPSIIHDGTPVVGEIVAFDFGTISGGVVGTYELIDNDDTIVQALTTASFQLNQAGVFRLRVHAAGFPAVFAVSAPMTVTTPAVGSMSAPILSWDTGRVAGTNPPKLMVESTDASIDKNTDSLVIEIDRNANGAFVVASTITYALVNIVSVNDTIQVPELKGLAAGPIRVRARFTRPATTPSPDSNTITDTLNAEALPPATTTWDPNNKSSYSTISNANRDIAGDGGVGAYMNIASTTSRSDRRFIELNVINLGTISYDKMFRIGIAPANVDCTINFGNPTGAIWHTVNGIDVTDTNYVLDITWSPDGVANGQMKVYRTGVLVATINHTLTSGKVVYGSQRDTKIRINAGQDAFTYTPAGSTRWN